MQISSNKQSIVRAICSIIVVLCHLNKTVSSPLLTFISPFGFLAVGVFFFFSGYNLNTSLIKNNYKLKKGFIYKKIINIYLPFVVANTVYGIFIKNLINFKDSIINSLKLILLNPTLWYIVDIIVVYIVYYLIIKIITQFTKINKHNLIYISILIYVISFIIVFLKDKDWLTLSPCLLMGFLYPNMKKININLNKNLIALLIAIIDIPFFLLKIAANNFIVNFIFGSFATLLLCFLILIIDINVNSRLLLFINNISLELYSYHYLVLRFLRGRFIYIYNDYIYIYIYIYLISIFLISTIMKYLHNKLKILININSI